MTIATLAIVATSALRDNVDVLAALPFDSPAQPTTQPSAIARPTRTPRVTATSDLGAFISPLSTPTPLPRALLAQNAKVYLPLVRKDPTPTPIKYGWKGVGGDRVAASNWYYNWGYEGVWAAAHGTQAQSAATIASQMAAAMADPAYVPMIWCTDDVDMLSPSPQTAAQIARDHPGRVWLIFNEPDNAFDGDGCGWHIEDDEDYSYISDGNWNGLGIYIAQQYGRYRDAIKAADPTARIFSPALIYLPLPSLQVAEPRAIPIWNAFLNELYRVDPNKLWLDGIALHAYPNHHSTYHSAAGGVCPGVNGNNPGWFLDAPCVQQALQDSYRYLQGSNTSGPSNPRPTMTRDQPIWITETGVLYRTDYHPNWRNELPLVSTRDSYQRPLLTWFQTVAVALAQPTPEPSSGCCMWFNALAWFVSYADKWQATSLLDAPGGNLNALGVNWRDAAPCPGCAGPGYDAP